MLFNSYEFILVFLPIVLMGFITINRVSRNYSLIWLSLCSVIFYGYWDVSAVPILITSVCLNYFFGLLITSGTKQGRYTLVVGLAFNLSVLFFYKYIDFFIYNFNFILNLAQMPELSFFENQLPIGISFFTFTQMVYLVDVYAGQTREKSFRSYFLFVTFFPQLVAGPFLYHKNILPQIDYRKKRETDFSLITLGIYIFTIGLAKKVLIADSLAPYVDGFYSQVLLDGMSPKFFGSWFASLAYTFQIYFDFSAYSDMAIGLGLMFGVALPINFNSPYKATSIIDYWQRWHMTLTAYIGQYLFAPLALSSMRKFYGKSAFLQWYGSIFLPNFLVFFIIGFWHGASWNFIIWGVIHSMFLIANHTWRRCKGSLPSSDSKFMSFFGALASWILTFACINVAFVMFRSPSLDIAMQVYLGMFMQNGIDVPGGVAQLLNLQVSGDHWLQLESGSSLGYVVVLVGAGLIALLAKNVARLVVLAQEGQQLARATFLEQNKIIFFFAGMLLVLGLVSLSRVQTFLYFQF